MNLRFPPFCAGLGSAFLAAACQCDEHRPYAPFRIEPRTSASASATPVASSEPPAFVPREAAVAPKDVSEWTLDGVAFGVDKSRVIDRALTADFNGDGVLDAVAWTRPRALPPDSHGSGELVLFSERGAAAGRVVAGSPPFVPAGPGCRHTVGLAATGPRTVALDLAAACDAPVVPRSPTRGILVVAPAAERPVVLGLRVADPAPGQTATYAVDSRDRDADGRDDVRVTLTVRTAVDDREAAADLVWLDRAAGPSRDAAEPGRSLGSIGSLEITRAPGKTTGKFVPGRVANARRVYAALCAESGTSRVFDSDGGPLPCGDLGAALGQLMTAEVRAFTARHDALGATAALGRDGWYGAPLGPKTRAALEKEVVELAKERVIVEHPVSPVPRARAGLPRLSPLAFESPTALLVQTAEGISRVRLPLLSVEEASEGVDPWPLVVGGGDAPRWTGIALPCDRAEVLLLLSNAEGTPLPPSPTNLLAPRPGGCQGGGKLPTPALAPLHWTSGKTVGLIGGALFGAPDLDALPGDSARGSPRSPDGKAVVSPWARGVLVLASGKPETWLANDPLALQDCVVANGAAAVACVRNDRAVVLLP